jgi:hypothetical protein
MKVSRPNHSLNRQEQYPNRQEIRPQSSAEALEMRGEIYVINTEEMKLVWVVK